MHFSFSLIYRCQRCRCSITLRLLTTLEQAHGDGCPSHIFMMKFVGRSHVLCPVSFRYSFYKMYRAFPSFFELIHIYFTKRTRRFLGFISRW